MKIKNMAAVLLLIWTCGFSSVVSAAEIQTVQLTEENQLVYTKDKTELAGAFDGMAPGDSRTVVIKIENQNSHKASFFISQKTTDALEEAGKASGGAYEFQVEIGNDTNRTSLLDADAGGYAENVASAEGLAEITELNEYRYMTALDPGDASFIISQWVCSSSVVGGVVAIIFSYALSIAPAMSSFQPLPRSPNN